MGIWVLQALRVRVRLCCQGLGNILWVLQGAVGLGALLPSSEIYLGTAAGPVGGALLPSSEIYLGTAAALVSGAVLLI